MNQTKNCACARVLIIILLVVTAVGLCAAEPASALTLRPSRVKEVRVTQVTYDTATIKWNAAKRADRYVVYRALSEKGEYTKAGTVRTTHFTDQDLRTASSYWYKVRAYNGKKHGFFSRKVEAVPVMKRPRLTVSSSGDGPVLKFSKVPGASGYLIYRDGKHIRKQKDTEFMDTAVQPGKQHEYKVVAFRNIGRKAVAPSPVSRTAKALKQVTKTGLDNVPMIPDLTQGDKFSLSGMIRSNSTIDRIEIGAVSAESDEWAEGFVYDASDIGKKIFDVAEADEAVAISALDPGEYRFRIRAHYLDGSEDTLMNQDFTVRETTEGGEAIISKARECAWPEGTSKGKYRYSGGNRTDAYTAALKEAYGSRSSWGAQTRAGASCDVFVGTVVRASGYDTGFPRGLDGIEGHISKNRDKWDVLDAPDESELRPGDVVFQIYNGGGGHVMIYLGDGKVANAHYVGKTYGIVQSYSSQAHSKGGCKTFKAYRPVQ